MKEHEHSNVSVQISGDQMSESDAGKVALAHVVSSIVNNALFRIGVIAVLWKSPELAEILLPLLSE